MEAEAASGTMRTVKLILGGIGAVIGGLLAIFSLYGLVLSLFGGFIDPMIAWRYLWSPSGNSPVVIDHAINLVIGTGILFGAMKLRKPKAA